VGLKGARLVPRGIKNMKILRVMGKIILYALAGLFILWGIFCLLGGPDAKFGSSESIIFGGSFLLLGLLCALMGKKIKVNP
jgi:hypothetical protein